jgi:hypothetical protein
MKAAMIVLQIKTGHLRRMATVQLKGLLVPGSHLIISQISMAIPSAMGKIF